MTTRANGTFTVKLTPQLPDGVECPVIGLVSRACGGPCSRSLE